MGKEGPSRNDRTVPYRTVARQHPRGDRPVYGQYDRDTVPRLPPATTTEKGATYPHIGGIQFHVQPQMCVVSEGYRAVVAALSG